MYRKSFYKQLRNDMIVSFGVLAYRVRPQQAGDPPRGGSSSAAAVPTRAAPEYLLVQRKDTLAFVEVCRGRYNVFNVPYLMNLFANMTEDEKRVLATESFDTIWESMWAHKRNNNLDYAIAKTKFGMLQNGVQVYHDDGGSYVMDLPFIIANCGGNASDRGWNIPRGRRNNVESNMCCALREFTEETGVEPRKLALSKRVKPFVLDKLGSNGIFYRAIYFVARCNDLSDVEPPLNEVQAKEIRAVRWFGAEDVMSRLETDAQRETFELVDRQIVASLGTHGSGA